MRPTWELGRGMLCMPSHPPMKRIGTFLGEPPGADLSFANCLVHRVHPDDREWCTEVLRKSLDPSGNGRLAAEFRLIRPDGREVWLKKLGKLSSKERGASTTQSELP